MPRSSPPFKIRLIGPPEHHRFVIRDNRRLADQFWTGTNWTQRLRDARLFINPADVFKTINHLTQRHLRQHEPKRLYLLTLVVRVHADESVSKDAVEQYLRAALDVSTNSRKFGTGPTDGSLVEVSIPVVSLEEAR